MQQYSCRVRDRASGFRQTFDVKESQVLALIHMPSSGKIVRLTIRSAAWH
jgi:hypothetical protein